MRIMREKQDPKKVIFQLMETSDSAVLLRYLN